MTCYTHNGESVVDYVLTSQANFEIISNFQIGDFIECSNHAPTSLTLQTFINMITNVEEEHISYKWNPEHKNAFLNDISRDILNRIVSDVIDSNYEPDDIVSCFTQFLTDRANPYFQKDIRRTQRQFLSTLIQKKSKSGITRNVRRNVQNTKKPFIILI